MHTSTCASGEKKSGRRRKSASRGVEPLEVGSGSASAISNLDFIAAVARSVERGHRGRAELINCGVKRRGAAGAKFVALTRIVLRNGTAAHFVCSALETMQHPRSIARLT